MVFAVFVDAVVQHGISQVLLVASHVIRDVPRMDVLAFPLLPGGMCRCSSRQPPSPLSNSCISISLEAPVSHHSPRCSSQSFGQILSILLFPVTLTRLFFQDASSDRLTSLPHSILNLKLATVAFSYLLLPPTYCDPIFSVFQLWRSRYINHAAHPPSLLSSTPQPSSTSLFSSA
jgi:hypothetical protein